MSLYSNIISLIDDKKIDIKFSWYGRNFQKHEYKELVRLRSWVNEKADEELATDLCVQIRYELLSQCPSIKTTTARIILARLIDTLSNHFGIDQELRNSAAQEVASQYNLFDHCADFDGGGGASNPSLEAYGLAGIKLLREQFCYKGEELQTLTI